MPLLGVWAVLIRVGLSIMLPQASRSGSYPYLVNPRGALPRGPTRLSVSACVCERRGLKIRFPPGSVGSSPTSYTISQRGFRTTNGTTTPCLSLSLYRCWIADKSAVLSPCVPRCRPLSLSGSDYESEGRRLESHLRYTLLCRCLPFVQRLKTQAL